MLKIIQIVALMQGLFLLFILYKNRSNYKKITFWLFFGSIVSILLYIVGDDDNNLFREKNDFIKILQNDQYTHYTLFGITNKAGFNSKSSFNSIFKKIKGVTPTQFKNTFTSKQGISTE